MASWKTRPYHVVSVLDDSYPHQLRGIHNRPALLFTEGQPQALIGAPGVAIFSGLAAGIDTAAHQEALRVGIRTVAVFGTGLRSVFPKANASLARDIVRADGALVSQFLPTQHAAKWTFPTRNITMSGLSVATVVVEAGETSGARMQARVALEHGRAVFLLQSLVDEHEWARVMVDRGIGNVRARMLRTSGDLVDGLSPDAELPELAPA